MTTAKKLFSLLLATLMIFSLAACAGGGDTTPSEAPASEAPASEAPAAEEPVAEAPASDITVGLSLATTTNNPHVAALASSLEEAVKAQGWNCIVQDADMDAARQSTQFDNLVTQEVDLIIYWPEDTEAAIADAKKAFDAGIPVINYFVPAADEAHQYISAYVGADQTVIAGVVADYAHELLGGEGNICIVNGMEGAPDFIFRSQGFRETIGQLGDYEILAEEWCSSDRTRAQTIMENYLTTYPDIDLVFTCNDDFGVGVYNAIEASGRDMHIVSIDGQPEVLELISQGKWDSTVYQTVGMMADKCIEVANAVFAGEEVEYMQFTDYYLVTQDNVQEYIDR